jgi:hypothetical protein
MHVVPELVGLPFHVGRDLAAEQELALANPDPDGPPIGNQAWPGLFYIVTQDPPAGTNLDRWASVRVTVAEHGEEPVGAPVPGSAPTGPR